ncbi:lytic transglycosylase domain-containing protein [Streptomyces sp. IB201691-2A2]|uniref:lytic transglycosylase domain-containing protein n=1 Tax=Streptomyces sp. IB201691-2A2 TaxID=2561920 RepID=UPI00117E695A|nr:lytic transglycosylase domain-containing protein [Streptomyces sp. IB201691-2A2]TRO55832.1 lytic transglycosylase domain-containing protein [Streptomyces sp. IB201691-2A2]
MTEKGLGKASSNMPLIIAGSTTGCGCLTLPVGMIIAAIFVLIVGGLGVLLLPLVLIVMLFTGQLDGPIPEADTSDLTAAEADCETEERIELTARDTEKAEAAGQIALGDGKGNLEISARENGQPCTVPEPLLGPINEAADKCDTLGPVLIAAQIQYESQFNENLVGPNGAEGISQVPKSEFEKINPDGDPFDPEQSIDTQASYLCSLAEENQKMLESGEVQGNVTDLTLAAYDAGIEEIREAKGVPATEASQSYIAGVRGWFAPMEGIGQIPRKVPIVPGLVDY